MDDYDYRVTEMSTNNLAIVLQKVAKKVTYLHPAYRTAVLNEAARRLVEYRQAERASEPSG